MRQIAQSFFDQSPLMAGPLLAMLIFLAVFGLVIVRVMRAGAEDVERSARMPLDDGGDDV